MTPLLADIELPGAVELITLGVSVALGWAVAVAAVVRAALAGRALRAGLLVAGVAGVVTGLASAAAGTGVGPNREVAALLLGGVLAVFGSAAPAFAAWGLRAAWAEGERAGDGPEAAPGGAASHAGDDRGSRRDGSRGRSAGR